MLSQAKHTGKTGMFRLAEPITVLLTLVVLLSAADAAAQNGKIMGKILDAETGEPIIGATALIQGTRMGAQANFEGQYFINKVAEGHFDLVVSSINYSSKTITGVKVVAGEATIVNVTLQPQATEVEGIKVQAKAEEKTEAALMRMRQRATSVSDAISAEDISRSGSGNAADAMSKVTGATVVDGKTVYIRGLGDRYANTNLNGSPLPSPDPDKQAVPMDLIPASLLDNIVVEKTFTPDKPGDFAGGSTNLSTKDYPESRTLKFSVKTGYNSQTSLKNGVLTQEGSDTDWLGYDDGLRDVPDFVGSDTMGHRLASENPKLFARNYRDSMPDSVSVLVNYLHYMSESFRPEMNASTHKAPLNYGYALSFGDMFTIRDRPLGVVASLTYSRNQQAITDGRTGLYLGKGLGEEASAVLQRGSDEVLWGGLASLTYDLHANHKINLSFMYNRSGEEVNEYNPGTYYYHLNNVDDSLRVRWLKYTERRLSTWQLGGSHNDVLGGIARGLRLDWQLSLSDTKGEEPDIRYLADVRVAPGYDEYYMDRTRTERPTRGWRWLDEDNKEYRVDLTLPLANQVKFKTGFSYLEKDRSYTTREFVYDNIANYEDIGDPNVWADDTWLALDTTIRTIRDDTLVYYNYDLGTYLFETTERSNQYAGHKRVRGTYAMLETPVPFIQRLSFAGGIRWESTDMRGEVVQVNAAEAALQVGRIDKTDALPAVNLMYQASDNMNLRASYGKTLARPTIRELAPAASEIFGSGRLFMGNENMRQTKIDNYDLRWEWFVRPGEVIAVSWFYKDLENPIEVAMIGNNYNTQITNVPSGWVHGVEFEFRRRLDWVSSILKNVRFGCNVTLAASEVEISKRELQGYEEQAPERPMPNQSPYVVNADIEYRHPQYGTSLSLFYNVFGRRFAINNDYPTPDIYEESRQQLDFMVAQPVLDYINIKFSAKNLLNEDVKFLYDTDESNAEDKDEEHPYKVYSKGVSLGLSVSYTIW